MRHSQGDHWILLVLVPMKSYAEYYTLKRMAKKGLAAGGGGKNRPETLSGKRIFCVGAAIHELRRAFGSASFFHIEMFHAIAGKQSELLKSARWKHLSQNAQRPENFIFIRDQGAAWDLFTIGVYRDLKHFAEAPAFLSPEQEAAAKTAGFEPPVEWPLSAHTDHFTS